MGQNTRLFFVTEHLPPYQIVNRNHELTGFAVDIIEEVAKRSGVEYRINAYSWMRSYQLTQKKANHCIFSIARIPSRETLFSWVGTITEVNNAVIWGIKSKPIIPVTNIDQLKQYVIAVNKDDVTHLGLLERGFKENENLYVLENTDSLISLLATRPEIDMIVADDITIAYRAELANVNINRLVRIFEISDLQLNFYLACNLNTDKAIIQKLSSSLENIHQDGFYQQKLNQWKRKMVHVN